MLPYYLKCKKKKNTESIDPNVSATSNGRIMIISKCAICGICFEHNSLNYKMNDTVNKFLLAGDKFMPEMHLRQLAFTYSACGPFTKNKERIQKFKQTGDSRYIYRNELDKACFQHDMAYGDLKI